MSAEFHNGSPHMVDHAPVGALSAGDMIQLGAKTCVVHNDIAAGDLGAVSVPRAGASYRIPLDAGRVIAEGAAVTVDLAAGDTSGGTAFGYAVAAVDQTAGDTHVIAVLDN